MLARKIKLIVHDDVHVKKYPNLVIFTILQCHIMDHVSERNEIPGREQVLKPLGIPPH